MTTFKTWPSDGGPHTSDSIGQALAGFIARDGSGNPVEGMLGAPVVSAVAGAWKVQVGRFVYVRNVSGSARLNGLSAAEQVNIDSSASIPAGQSRIDVVIWDAVAESLSVAKGTPAATPVAPSTSGYVPIAQVQVNSGDAQVVSGQITTVFTRSRLAGGAVAVGTVSKRSVVAGGATSVAVTFPAGMFSEPPNVQATVLGSMRDVNVSVDDITATGCTITLGSNSIVARTFGATWRAEAV